MLKSISEAKESVDLEEFILEQGDIGEEFLSLLEKRCNEGIKIRLLLDWWGCKKFARSERCAELIAKGLDIRFFRPPEWNWLTSSPRLLPRDHRKILIIDKQTSYIGGVCIYDDITNWRDTMLELTEPLTQQLNHIFENTWDKTDPNKDESQIKAHPNFETVENFSVFANAPDSSEHHFTDLLIDTIYNSNESVRLVTPYFTPGKRLLPALHDALNRGVKVEILLSDYSKYAPYVVGKRICGELIQNGAYIYYYKPTMLHLKMMLIDDKWAAIGSCNLDGLSIHQNQEAMLVSHDAKFIDELQSHFDIDKSKSARFTLADWKARPITQKLTGLAFTPFKYHI